MKNYFLDTYGLYAWLNAKEQHHEKAKEIFNQRNCHYVVTEWILLEFANGMSHLSRRGVGIKMLELIRKSSVFEIIEYNHGIFQSGYNLYINRPDKQWSLTDCISFEVMAARGLTEALTADHHFRQAGFHPVFAA
jgi:hypothetical protein